MHLTETINYKTNPFQIAIMNPSVPSNLTPSHFQKFDPAAAEKKIVKFIRRTVRDSGASGVVLGLSGGIDSALVAALSVKALGAGSVFPIFFYTTESSADFDSEDLRDAVLLADRLGLVLQKINLSSLDREAKTVFSSSSSESLSDPERDLFQNIGETPVTTGNLKSRLRMALLYYYANRTHLLVIGTKNKTERMTGYFTKYGDGGVDIDPIADLYKTEVRLLSKYLNLPDSILNKAPSAGFWEGQADENEFGMRYEQLDALLSLLEREKKDRKKSKKFKNQLKKIGLTPEQYESIAVRMNAAVHKQKMPQSPKMPKY